MGLQASSDIEYSQGLARDERDPFFEDLAGSQD